MRKVKLRLLFFIMSLIAPKSIVSMSEGQQPHTTTEDTHEIWQDELHSLTETETPNTTECPVCYEDEQLYSLSCGHEFCINCFNKMIAEDPLKPYLKKCPLCRKSFIQQDYAKIASANQKVANHERLLGAAKTSVKAMLACALAGYGLYRYFGKKKPVNNKPTVAKDSWPSWLSKKFSSTKQNIKEKAKAISASYSKSDILVPTVVSSGLFTLLTAKQINIGKRMRNYWYKPSYGLYYNNQENSWYKNTGIKHTINAGCSIIVGLLARNCYKLFSGEHYNSKKKPNLSPKNQVV